MNTAESAQPYERILADPPEIRRALIALFEPGQVVEVRALGTRRGTQSGYFEDFNALIRQVEICVADAEPDGVYVVLNPFNPTLFARAANSLTPYARHTTADADILCRRWLPVDLDAVRPAGVSSTDAEHAAAIKRGGLVREFLAGEAWPPPVFADSGNGAHLLYPIILPNDRQAATLVKRVLATLASRFDDDLVKVDRTTFNASRIFKLYGTPACKGCSVPARPHRLARLIQAQEWRAEPVVTREMLEEFVPELGDGEELGAPSHGHDERGSRIDLERYIAEHNIRTKRVEPYDGGRRFILEGCLFNEAHRGTSAALLQLVSGALVYRCLHNGCAERTWHDVRDLFEPSGRTRASVARDDTAPTVEVLPIKEAALIGPAGEFVKRHRDRTEAPAESLLFQLLAAAAALVGRGPFANGGGTRHGVNLYVVIVGQTSSGRKGTARAQVERQIRLADPEFARNNLVSGLASGEGLIHSVRDKIEKTVPLKIKGRFTGEYETYIDDHGVDDKRLCVFESEFSRLLKSAAREGNILSEILRLAWDGHDLRTIVKNFPETATAPHISLVAHVTKDELHTCFETVEYSNGFGNRFLWVASARNKLLPFTPDISDELLEPVAGHLRLARDFWSGNTEQSQFSVDARDRWITVYPSLTADRDGLAGGLLARAEAQVLRLALLYSALDCSREIHVEHLNAALACWEYCENSTRAIFGDAIGRPAADRILEALRTDAHGLTRTQISSLFGRNLMATTIVDAINELESAGKARCTKMQGPNGGRPTETWFAADKS